MKSSALNDGGTPDDAPAGGAPDAHTPEHPAPGLRFPDHVVFRGYAAPVRIEADVYDCEVDGIIPTELNGSYYRNSADHQYPPLHGSDIFLNGDGMLHMVRFDNGHADLKTRFVRTERFKLERAARRALYGHYRNPFFDDPSVAGLAREAANTSVMWHANKLFALKEDARPVEIDPETLETRGTWDFHGKLTSKTFTAHPKRDPLTGEMIAFGYNTNGTSNNLIEYFVISPCGEIIRAETFEAPYCSMIHDYHVSRNYLIFTICPMVNDWERVRQGKPFWHWDSKKPTVVAVIPRNDGVKGLRWFRSAAPVMQTHTFNAWESGSLLNIDHFINTSGWLSQFPDLHDPGAKEAPPFAERWTFDMGRADDTYTVTRLFDHIGEMPAVDSRYLMSRSHHFYFGTSNTALGPMLEFGPKGPPFTCLGHFDERKNALEFYYAGANSSPEEPLFVPKPGGQEGEGWLLSVVGRRAEMRTDLVILDASRISAGPIATVHFPCRLHEGFHGIWVSNAQLYAARSPLRHYPLVAPSPARP